MAIEHSSGLILPKITTKDISTWISLFPEDVRKDRQTLLHATLLVLIREFLGNDFCQRHLMKQILSPRQVAGYMTMDLSSQSRLQTQIQKIYEFSEALLNLQFADGFDERINDIRSADDKRVESAFAEFTAASMLLRQQISFRFIKETGVRGRDYDFEIMLDASCTICADAKCKLEATEIDTDSVKQSLQDARGQLPADRPGLIFVKVPQAWLEKPLMKSVLRDVAAHFMKSTGRIVNVIYLSKTVSFNGPIIHVSYPFQENLSETHRFPKRDYRLFGNRPIPRDHLGRVRNWIRMMDVIEDNLI